MTITQHLRENLSRPIQERETMAEFMGKLAYLAFYGQYLQLSEESHEKAARRAELLDIDTPSTKFIPLDI
jgi:hypothetical protein